MIKKLNNQQSRTMRFSRILFLLLLVIGASKLANAQKSFKVDDLYYKFVYGSNDTKVYVSDNYPSSQKPKGDIVIPETIEYKGKTYPVTEIGHFAFKNCTEMTSVVIPNSITSIKAQAFAYCQGLTSIKLPNSLNEISSQAFFYCSNIISIISEIEELTSLEMGSGVFMGIDNLNCVLAVPEEKIEDYKNAKQWKDFINIQPYKAVTGINLVEKNKIIGINEELQLTGNVIPENASNKSLIWTSSDTATVAVDRINGIIIGKKAGNAIITLASQEGNFTATCEVTVNNTPIGTKFAEGNLFYEIIAASPLQVAVVPEILDEQAHTATWNSIAKPSGDVKIPEEVKHGGNTYAVTSLGRGAFLKCAGVTSITIPNSITKIDGGALYQCTGLTSVTIPNSVTSIGNSAFKYCSNLTSVTIPNSVKTIGKYAFRSCEELPKVVIPNSVKIISDYAFANCEKLVSVEIPNSVNRIESGAFYACSDLRAIHSKIEDVYSVYMGKEAGEVFSSVSKQKCTLYVPKGKVEDYKNAEQWKDFFNIKEDEITAIEFTNESNIAIYPTNVQTGFIVENATQQTTLEVFTITGKKVLSTAITSNKQFVNINNLKSGVYLVKAGNKTTKIIKLNSF